jgi:hypothetical protein
VDRWILSAVCVGGLGLAVLLAVRWGGLRRAEPASHDRGYGANALATLRAVTVTLYAAAIAGILVAGLGARLFMRILAATSPDSLRGVSTQADEEIGRVTFGGTAFLVVFGGLLAGLIGAGAYRLGRRWLPKVAWQAGAVTSVVLFGIFGAGQDVLAADNKDFQLLSPVWLAVLLIAATTALFGVTIAAVHDRLEVGLPQLSRSVKSVAAYAPLLLFAMTIVVLPVALSLVIVGGFAAPFAARLAKTPVLVRWGRRAVAAAAAVSVFVVASNAFDVLTLD